MIRCPFRSVLPTITIVKLSQDWTWNNFALWVIDVRLAYLYLIIVASWTTEPHVTVQVGYIPASTF